MSARLLKRTGALLGCEKDQAYPRRTISGRCSVLR